jgi:hypothetical protein
MVRMMCNHPNDGGDCDEPHLRLPWMKPRKVPPLALHKVRSPPQTFSFDSASTEDTARRQRKDPEKRKMKKLGDALVGELETALQTLGPEELIKVLSSATARDPRTQRSSRKLAQSTQRQKRSVRKIPAPPSSDEETTDETSSSEPEEPPPRSRKRPKPSAEPRDEAVELLSRTIRANPTKDAVVNMAIWLGLDPSDPGDAGAFWVAEEALLAPLPEGWAMATAPLPSQAKAAAPRRPGGPPHDELTAAYYYRVDTEGRTVEGSSQWEHPLDGYYRAMARRARDATSTIAVAASSHSAAPPPAPVPGLPPGYDPGALDRVLHDVTREAPPPSLLSRAGALAASAVSALAAWATPPVPPPRSPPRRARQATALASPVKVTPKPSLDIGGELVDNHSHTIHVDHSANSRAASKRLLRLLSMPLALDPLLGGTTEPLEGDSVAAARQVYDAQHTQTLSLAAAAEPRWRPCSRAMLLGQASLQRAIASKAPLCGPGKTFFLPVADRRSAAPSVCEALELCSYCDVSLAALARRGMQWLARCALVAAPPPAWAVLEDGDPACSGVLFAHRLTKAVQAWHPVDSWVLPLLRALTLDEATPASDGWILWTEHPRVLTPVWLPSDTSGHVRRALIGNSRFLVRIDSLQQPEHTDRPVTMVSERDDDEEPGTPPGSPPVAAPASAPPIPPTTTFDPPGLPSMATSERSLESLDCHLIECKASEDPPVREEAALELALQHVCQREGFPSFKQAILRRYALSVGLLVADTRSLEVVSGSQPPPPPLEARRKSPPPAVPLVPARMVPHPPDTSARRTSPPGEIWNDVSLSMLCTRDLQGLSQLLDMLVQWQSQELVCQTERRDGAILRTHELSDRVKSTLQTE